MESYEITAPESAPKKVTDRIGEGLMTLDELRDFVCSLHPQTRFQKQMAAASAEDLIAYLEQNGYEVHEQD